MLFEVSISPLFRSTTQFNAHFTHECYRINDKNNVLSQQYKTIRGENRPDNRMLVTAKEIARV